MVSVELCDTPLSTEDRLLAMGHMAACLAHELRNPLGSMELYGSLLTRELSGNEAALELLAPIMNGMNTMKHVIENCLQFTKEIQPKTQVFTSADTFLQQTCQFVEEGEEESVHIDWQEIGNAPFEMDPYLLGQVLLNLLRNAVDAAKETSGEVRVVFDHSDETQWTMIVEDTGLGIPDTIQSKLFDPFFTTKEKGTGLGLPIVHSIVNAHSGEISLENLGDAQGTRVTVVCKNTHPREGK